MKHLTRLIVVVAAAGLAVSMFGCPKRCVKPDEPIAPPPPPEQTAEIVDILDEGGEMTELGLETIHFDFDRSEIRPGDAGKLEANGDALMAAALKGYEPMVSVEGHCDPVGTAEYNIALGQRRAESARAFLVKMGVPAAQLTCVSYGEEKLITQQEPEFELNRRVEFKVVE